MPAFKVGRVTVSGTTPSPLPVNFEPGEGVQLRAPMENTGTIYIGNSNVSSDQCYPLYKGDTVFIPADNANTIYALAQVNGEFLHYMVV